MKIKGKYYKNNFVSLISMFLYNARWTSLVLLVCNALPVLETATSVGLSNETCFWGWCWILVTIGLIYFHRKLTPFYDGITDFINSRIK